MGKTKLLAVFIFAWFCGLSQDEFTIAHSLYSPTTTFYHNPTNTLDNKVWLDIHVLGAAAFVQNDLVYFPKEEFGLIRSFSGGGLGQPQFNFGPERKFGYLDLDVQLLSGSFQYKEHGFALGITARAGLDFRRVSTEVGQLFTEGIGDINASTPGASIEANRMLMNQALFGEFALSYSNLFYHFDHTSMGLGVTAKYLYGIAGAAIRISDAELNIQGNPLTDYINLGGSAAFATPTNGFSSGRGFAVDLGFVYKKTLTNVSHYEPFFKSNSCRPYDYKYKLSASLIDLGFIGFNQGATRYDYAAELSAEDFGEDFAFDGFGSFANDLLNGVSESNSFTMYMPVAVNVMADYNFENNFYVSGQFMGGLFRQFSFGVKRPLVLAASGRYQRKWFEGSASISAYDFNSVRLGLGLRLAYLTVGTDHLLSYFGVQDFTGTDVYFNLRFFFSKKRSCDEKGRGSRKSRKKRNRNNKNRGKTGCRTH